jgi:nucleoside-diphosphate-sugar epimerase
VLVFGGTGFVGSTFIQKAVERGHSVVAVARRQPTQPIPTVTYITADAVNEDAVRAALRNETEFDACVHAVGLLFDSASGLGQWNVHASGSGSVPSADATYDRVTRQTAFNALSIFTERRRSAEQPVPSPFVFVSAAEAGWTFKAPVAWLERYLTAKRAVEAKLLGDGTAAAGVRPIVFRPSMIWTPARPLGLLAVAPFYLGHALRLPIVDRPVTVDSLATAMLVAVESGTVRGVQRFADVDRLAAQAATRRTSADL